MLSAPPHPPPPLGAPGAERDVLPKVFSMLAQLLSGTSPAAQTRSPLGSGKGPTVPPYNA